MTFFVIVALAALAEATITGVVLLVLLRRTSRHRRVSMNTHDTQPLLLSVPTQRNRPIPTRKAHRR